MKYWFLLCACSLFSLPQDPKAVAGDVSFTSKNSQTLEITTSDQAIVNFKQFDIQSNEKVTFIQPSKNSCILNRITGEDPSHIFGSLEANGKVFLVNPRGIYFGPESSINAHSFIASTLHIRNEDFLSEKYEFYQEGSTGSLVHEGSIGVEGFVALLGPVIQNRGVIAAQTGRIVIGAAEKVTIDFSGDGLIHFTAEGELEQALIENEGVIRASSVEMTLRAAQRAIHSVVNMDGVEMAEGLIASDGEIRLIGRSEIIAEKITLDGDGNVEVGGSLQGHSIHIFGDEIALKKAQLDATGSGEVLIGGDYQGKGDFRKAFQVSMDEESIILADGLGHSSGGKVILWSEDTTLFDGKIYARGGSLGGDGGFVETSGKMDLGIETGFVDTSAPFGNFGMWLLDPNTIIITTPGPASIAQCSAPHCADNSNRTISPATIAASLTNVALCAQQLATSSITVNGSVTMSNAGVSLSLTAGSTNVGPIALNASITTRGAPISLTGVVTLGATVTLDTTNAGASPTGGNITFSSTVNGAHPLTCNSGTGGTVLFTGAVGGTTALSSLSATGATVTQSSTAKTTGALSYSGTSAINLASSITTSAGIVTLTGPVNLTGAGSIDSTNGGASPVGANITFSSTVNGAQTLTCNAGTSGTVLFTGAVGGTTALSSLSATGATITQSSTAKTTGALSYNGTSAINLANSITTSGGTITLTGPVNLTGTVSLDSTNAGASAGANISASSTINGSQNLTLRAGSGSITLSGAVGGITRLGSLTMTSAQNVTAAAITASSIAQSAGTGTTTFNGNLDTNGAAGIVLTANNVSFNANVNTTGGGPVTITNAGTLSISNATTMSLTGAFTQNGAGVVNLAGSITTTNLNISFLRAVSLTNTASLSSGSGAGDITFSSTVNGNQNLNLTAGTGNVFFSGVLGGVTPLNTVTINSASNVTASTFSSAVLTQVAGTGVTTFNGPITLTGASGLSLTTSNVTFNQNLQTSSGGPASLNVSGTFILASGVSMSLDGPFTQSGAGGNQLAGSITTTNDSIQFAGAVSLTGSTQLNTGSGIGDILFSSQVNGPGDLTLSSGTGNITFSSNAGIGTRLGAFTVNSVANLTLQAFSATSIFQVAGTGTTTSNGAIDTSGAAGITLVGNAFSRGGTITTTGGGPFIITNSGTASATALSDTLIDGYFLQNGTGGVVLGGLLRTSNGSISFSGPLTLGADATLNSSLANGAISISNTIDGAQNLTLISGGGDITLGSAVGGTTRLTSVAINSANNVTSSSIKAGSISQLTGTGTSTFNGALDTNTVSGINLVGSGFTFNSTVTTTLAGPITVQNSGILTIASTAVVTSAGVFSQTGAAGSVSFAGSISATGAVSFTSPVTLSSTPSINTSVSGANISFLNTVDGAGSLTLASGTGDILFQSAVGGGTRIGALTLSSVANLTTQAMTMASIQSTATATTVFNGALDANAAGGINVSGVGITFISNATASSGPISLTNSGTLTLSNGTSISSSGTFTQSGGGAVSIGASVTTANANLSFTNNMTLTSTVALSTGIGAGNLSIGGTVNGAQNLSLTAGTGNITLSSALGGTTRLSTVTFVSNQNANVGSVTANSIAISNSTGAFTVVGNFDANGASGIQASGNQFAFTGNLTTTSGGAFNINNSGAITLAAANVASIDGGYFQTGSGLLNLAGTITTNNTPISFAGPITLTNTTSLNSGGGAGNITFSNTVNGTAALTITAGTANLLFSSAVGATNPLGAVTINSANDITMSSTFAAASISGTSIQGLVTLNGAVSTSGALGISLSANHYAINAGITTTGTGPLTLNLTGSSPLTIANGVSFNLDGAFSQTGTGSVSSGGSITTTNDAISFASPFNLTADVALNTGIGAGDITFSAAINGAHGLTIAAGTGNLIFNGSIGALTPLSSLSISSGTNLTTSLPITVNGSFLSTVSGTTTFNNSVLTTTIGGMNFSSATFAVNGSLSTTNLGPIVINNSGTLTISSNISSSAAFSQTGAGAVSLQANVSSVGNLSFHGPATLANSSTLNSGNGNLSFDSTIDGAFDLILTAGTGSVTLSAAVGGTTPLGHLTLNSATNVTTQAISCAWLQQIAGSGLTHFQGNLSTTSINGISLTGTQFQLDGTVTSTSAGPVNISHIGSLTIPFGASMNLSGFFNESGSGAVSLGADITTANNNISFASAITLTHDVILNSGVMAGDITFGSTVDGAFCLTLSAGTATVQFNADLGSITALNCLNATAATIVQNSSIIASTTVQQTGAIQLGGNITTSNSDITLTGNVTRTFGNSVTLSTGAGIGNISITGTINGDIGGRDLTLNAGGGSVTIGNTIGGVGSLNNLSISGNTIALANIGTTTSGVSGTISFNATTSITFNGSNYFGGAQSYTAGTSFIFNAGASTTLTSNNQDITFTTGTIELQALTPLTANSHGGNITFSDLTGPGLDLTVNANVGAFTFTNIGTMASPLNVVNLTQQTLNGMISNIHATTLIHQSPTIITLSSDVNFSGALIYGSPVQIATSPITISTCLGGGSDITFNGTLNSDSPLTLRSVTIDSCGTQIFFNAPIGGIAPLASLTIQPASNVQVNQGMNVGTFTQTGGTGTTSLNGGITTSAVGGINIQTSAISVQNIITTTNGGPVVFQNAGTLTSTANFSLDGPFTQSGSGSVSISGSITTSDDAITLNSATTLTGSLLLNTVSTTGGNIHFVSTIDGAQNLTFAAGTAGSIALDGALGGTTRLGNLTINSAANVTTAAVTAASIIQNAGAALSTFGGAVDTNSLNGISLTGNQFTFSSTVNTTASGPVLIDNAGLLTLNGNCTISGSFQQTGSGLNQIATTMTAGNGISFTSAITLTGASSFDTSLSLTPITLTSVDGAFPLSFNLGSSGALTISADIGTTTRIGSLTIVNAGSISAQNVTAASITQNNTGAFTTLLSLNTNAVGGISLTGSSYNINGDLITTNGGNFAVANGSTLTLAAGANSLISGSFSQTGVGAVFLSGTIVTQSSNLSFASAVTLNGATSVSSGLGAGNITFGSTVAGAQNLTLSAGIGNISFNGSVGSLGRLNTLTIQNATDISYGIVSAATVVQEASSGTTTIGGAMNTNGSSGISLTGVNLLQNATLTTTNSGPIAVVNTGTWTIGANITSSGGLTQTGGGSVLLKGTIATTNRTISFADAVTLFGAAVLNTGGAGLGDILFSNTINGAYDITFTAGTGSITLGAAVGGGTRIGTLTINSMGGASMQAVTAAAITQNNGTGTSFFHGALDTNTVAGISLTGEIFTLAGNVTTTLGGGLSIANSGTATLSGPTFSLGGALSQTGTGAVVLSNNITAGGEIAFSGAATISGSASLSTSSQLIDFQNTVDGSGNLTLSSGSNDILFFTTVGGTTRLGNLTISSVRTLSAQAITATSLIQSAGSSGSTFNGAIDVNGAGGVQITGVDVTFLDNVNASGGAISIVNTGVLTTTAAKTIHSLGSFTQDAGGTVSLAGTVTTSGTDISFADPVTLTASVILSTGSGTGNITFSNTVDGTQSLDLTAGTGNISINASAGLVEPIGPITIHSANNVSFQALDADSIQLLAATGVTTFSGALNTSGSNGIQLTGTDFNFSAAISTTNGGPFTITNSGTLSEASVSTSISGPYTQNGAGPVELSGTITTGNQNISFSSSITLLNDVSLQTGTGTGGITLTGGVNGAFSLSLSSGGGDISILSTIGNITPVNVFDVSSCHNFSSNAISATSISLTNVSGTATFNSTLNTSGASGISLSGGAFNCNGNITCSGIGGLSLNNSFDSSFSNIAILLGGSFSQTGIGNLNIGGSITTNNQNISFQSKLFLTGNLTLNSGSGAGNITLAQDLEGAHAFTVSAGTGNFTSQSSIGDETALTSFTVNSANQISLVGVGTSSSSGVTNEMSLTSSGLIAFNGFFYNTGSQTYSSGADLDMQTGSRVTLISTGPITISTGNVHLNSGTDLYIQTHGGDLSYSNLRGTNFENFVVDAGSGTVTVSPIDSTLSINNVDITAGSILLAGEVKAINVTFTSSGSILNLSSAVDIQSSNTASLNALGGNVGSLSSPILVHTNNQIFAGSTDLANFNGSSIDNAIHSISSNPPCVIIFNGVTLQDCHIPSSLAQATTFPRSFPSPGFDSSQFNLASDFYFLPDYLDKRYFLLSPDYVLVR